ncbi:hypothetical protein NC653_035322 [Populus alba x Populus x berolinensis]|uniref:Transmembrane protein n=1 Tax=Populus alba x Populus x berolinensis TaxID=444605 RepID=A0AAD6LPU0_9ROSI|nr:hypothetical protein NC653_035322 [Populus alba x Populus x berolinensis]
MRQFLYKQRKEISIPGSEESGADGAGGLLCCFLHSGKERADGGLTPLLVLRFMPVLGSSFGFASSPFSLLSCSHPLLSVFFPAVSPPCLVGFSSLSSSLLGVGSSSGFYSPRKALRW